MGRGHFGCLSRAPSAAVNANAEKLLDALAERVAATVAREPLWDPKGLRIRA